MASPIIFREEMMQRNRWWQIFVVSLATILVLFLFPGQGSQLLTLADIMRSAFPSNLIASPAGDVVAWVFNEQGKRNIWIARGPEYKPLKLTNNAEDDGQEIAELAFSHDGATIVFVQGGPANRAGEYPNPKSDPEGVEQSAWAVSTSGGEPWRLGEGSHPVPSPTENAVVYLLRGKIYAAPLGGKDKPRLLFRARGLCSQPVWSPDGSKLAFTSSREDHSFIGLYDFAQKSITWIAPSVDRDIWPAFSPDGKKLAFFRFPGSMGSPSFVEGQPFSLMAADLGTGKAKELWRSPDESGGFGQSYPAMPLQWAARERILFYSEHEGWMHIYSQAAEGGAPVCLTLGESEVEDCALSPDRNFLVFNSNAGDIDRRHLWRVAVTGGKPELLTPGQGNEWAPVWAAGGKEIVFLCSTAFQPAAPAVLDVAKKARQLLAAEAIPAVFSEKTLVEPRAVVFKAPDGLEIHGQLFLPAGGKAGDNRSAVIFMHGGPIRQMLLGWHMRGYYHNAYAFNQYLASRGYVVLSVNFRSGIGYGRAFRTAPNQGPRGASEYQDIVAAAKYLQSRTEVNPQKIGLWGGSYGGYLTALGLARDSELFAAGVDLHGVHDWALRGRRRDGGGWGIQGEELMRSAFDSSPVADVRFWSSPALFIHGDDDRNVDFIQTVDLVQRLRKEGRAHVETLIFPDEVHGFLLHRRWLEAFTAAADFFDRFLKAPASKKSS